MTQRYEILRALRAAGPAGLTSREMSHDMEIERFGARLKELRAEGYAIETLRDLDSPDGKRRYRYVLRAEQEELEAPRPAPRPADTPADALFDLPAEAVSAVTGRRVAA